MRKGLLMIWRVLEVKIARNSRDFPRKLKFKILTHTFGNNAHDHNWKRHDDVIWLVFLLSGSVCFLWYFVPHSYNNGETKTMHYFSHSTRYVNRCPMDCVPEYVNVHLSAAFFFDCHRPSNLVFHHPSWCSIIIITLSYLSKKENQYIGSLILAMWKKLKINKDMGAAHY